MRTREERLAANEALFREVNERIAEVSERFASFLPLIDVLRRMRATLSRHYLRRGWPWEGPHSVTPLTIASRAPLSDLALT